MAAKTILSNQSPLLVGNIALNYDISEHFSIMARSGTDYWLTPEQTSTVQKASKTK